MNQAPRILFGCALIALGAPACGSKEQVAFAPKTPTVQATRNAQGNIDDKSLCEWQNKPERESTETAGPGSLAPNVRRVYQVIGQGEDRHKVLICREIDTNFDGVKDVVRRYTEKGESLAEESDSNFDGRIDTWITFVKGRLAEVKLDSTHDGKIDEWKYYSNGKVNRVTRDTNGDTKPDVWEIYREGKLERMGVDVDGDEHVDRWDHDNELRRRFDEAERKKDADAAAALAKKAAEEQDASDKANDAVDDGSGARKDTPKSPRKKK